MGQTETTANKHDYSKFKERFEIKKKLLDKKYGDGTLIEDKTTKSEAFLKEYILKSSFEYNEFYAKIYNKENTNSPYIVDIIDYFTLKESHFCSEQYKLYVLFEFCNKNLEMEINDRVSNNNKRFTNQELSYITKSYITALLFLQINKISHNNINLQTLLISKNGIYKLGDQDLLKMQSNFKQIKDKKIDCTGIYLSPSLILALRNKKEEPEHNYKDDVFTLGMCLLHIALLKPCDDLFNYEEMVFLSNNMEKKYEEMGKYYSDRLTKFIKKMTVEQEEQRDDLIVLNDVFDQIIKMNEERGEKTISRKNTIESVNPDKNAKIKKVSKDIDPGSSVHPSLLRTKMSTMEFTPNQWKHENGKLRDTNLLLRSSFLKNPNQIHTNSFEKITEAKEDSDIFSLQEINNMDINDLLKEYGFEPLQRIPRNLKNLVNAAYEPIYQNNFARISNEKRSSQEYRFCSSQINQKNNESSDYENKQSVNFAAKSNKRESPFSENDSYVPFLLNNATPNQTISLSSPKKNEMSLIEYSFNKSKIYNDNFDNGSKYEGEKINGIKTGYGKFVYPSGAYYEGQWKDNKKHGKGILINSDGKTIYEGHWMNDKYHGKGILHNLNIIYINDEFEYKDFNYLDKKWFKYDGIFSEDLKNGKGILYLSNSERFYGNFEKDIINGSGSFYTKNGDMISGEWKNNKFRKNS